VAQVVNTIWRRVRLRLAVVAGRRNH